MAAAGPRPRRGTSLARPYKSAIHKETLTLAAQYVKKYAKQKDIKYVCYRTIEKSSIPR